MAIQLTAISKQANDRYSITIQDTDIQIGLDKDKNPIYQVYSINYNPATGKDHLKANIESFIKKNKALKEAEAQIMQDIKTTVESIDVLKIGE